MKRILGGAAMKRILGGAAMKRILPWCTALIPLLASSLTLALTTSAPQEVPPPGTTTPTPPSTIACDIGPSYIGSIPGPAQAAGFTHCVANFDFTQTASFTTNGHTYTWSNTASWIDECGAANPLAWVRAFANKAPCGDFVTTTDGGNQVLQTTYTPSDYTNGVQAAWLGTDSGQGIPNPPGLKIYQGYYAEESVRLTANTADNICPAYYNNKCLEFDFWSYPVGGSQTCPNCTGTVESDFVEMYVNPTSTVSTNYSSGGSWIGGAIYFAHNNAFSQQTNYNIYGALNTVVNSSSGNNWSQCLIFNEQSPSTGCFAANTALANITEPPFDFYPVEVGPQTIVSQCNGSCQPTGNVVALVQRMTIWACPTYASGPCFTSSVVEY